MPQDLVGRYTGIDIMLGSDLNFHAVQNKLTPRIGAFTAVVQEELDFAMEHDFPKCNGTSLSQPSLDHKRAPTN